MKGRFVSAAAAGVLAAAAAAVLVMGCGGGGNEAKERAAYLDVLGQAYPAAQASFRTSITPCLARNFPACRAQGQAVQEAAGRLLAELRPVEAPQPAKAADRQLRTGFEALIEATGDQRRAIDAGNSSAFALSITKVVAALSTIDTGRDRLNDLFPSLSLPPVSPH